MNKRYGLIGETLQHSFSPMIHNALSDYSYELCSLSKERLEGFLMEDVIEKGLYSGLNVTIPYKQAVMPFCHKISPEAAEIGCVNTLVRAADGSLIGYNTDAYGFLYMAGRSGIDFEGKKVLILGSGGTSLTAAYSAKKMGAREIVKVSRSGPVTYEDLRPGSKHTQCADGQFHNDAQIIINTTPVGMYPNNGEMCIDLKDFPDCEGVLDVIYNPFYTALLLQAKERNIPCGNGLAMLVAQAKRSAEYFIEKKISDLEIERIYGQLERQLTNIVLIGMPGSGKTTIGMELAKRLDRPLLDTDAMVETAARKTIAQIFEEEGEVGFRMMEKEAVSAAGKRTGVIVSTGGGVVLGHENYLNLKQNGVLFFIQRDLEDLPIQGLRPLSRDIETLREMQEKRLPLYLKYADVTVDNNGEKNQAVEQVLTALLK